jgi:hypothetical protein
VLIRRYGRAGEPARQFLADTTRPTFPEKDDGSGLLLSSPLARPQFMLSSDSHSTNSAGKVGDSVIHDPHVINPIVDDLVAVLSEEHPSLDRRSLHSIVTRSIVVYAESQLVENRQFKMDTRRGTFKGPHAAPQFNRHFEGDPMNLEDVQNTQSEDPFPLLQFEDAMELNSEISGPRSNDV